MAKTKVTPEMAAKWLAADTENRPIRESRVQSYADQIRRGEWVYNGESIIINDKNGITDGQHRLRAVVQAGLPIVTEVVTGVKHEEVFDTIDSAPGRTGRDRMALRGEDHIQILAGAVSWLYKLTHVPTGRKKVTVTPHAEAEMLKKYPEVRDGISYLKEFQFYTTVGGKSIISALWVLFGRHDKTARDEFFDQFSTGEGIPSGGVVAILRDRLFQESTHKLRKVDQKIIGALIIKAFNFYITGTKTKLLRFRPDVEAFPRIGVVTDAEKEYRQKAERGRSGLLRNAAVARAALASKRMARTQLLAR